MPGLTLYFVNEASPQLDRVDYSGVSGTTNCCIRGSLAPAGIRTFPWSTGVKAASLSFLRYLLIKDSNGARLSGEAKSAAAALDYAIAKSPAWLLDLFGCESNGTACARRLFRRLNPERKRPGPVQIFVNDKILSPASIKCLINGECCSSEEALRRLISQIASYWPGYNAEYIYPSNGALPQVEPAAELELVPDAAPRNADVVYPPGICVIGESDLVVVKSITVAWKLEEILSRFGISCKRVVWDWSDDLLWALENGRVNIAVYNTTRTRRFLGTNKAKNILILGDFGFSMGGKNFYVLARSDSSWRNVESVPHFLTKLKSGATIALPEDSDMLDNFLAVTGCSRGELTNAGVRFIRVPVSQGLEALDLNPDALLIHGQNVRLQARYRGKYKEVLNYDMLPPEVQSVLRMNAGNSLIIDRRLLKMIDLGRLQQVAAEAKNEFYNSWLDMRRYPVLLKEVLAGERKYGVTDEREMTYVVEQVLYETYRLGKPEL